MNVSYQLKIQVDSHSQLFSALDYFYKSIRLKKYTRKNFTIEN